MNRILAAVTPVRVAFLAVGLVVGVASGAAAAGTPDVKAPHQCTVMATVAEKAFVAYENLATSTHLAATRGRSEFDKHEADKASLRGELDDLGPDYHEAKAACLGGAR